MSLSYHRQTPALTRMKLWARLYHKRNYRSNNRQIVHDLAISLISLVAHCRVCHRIETEIDLLLEAASDLLRRTPVTQTDRYRSQYICLLNSQQQ